MKHVFVVETDRKLSAETVSLLISLVARIVEDKHNNALVCSYVNQGKADKQLLIPNDNWTKL